MKSLRIMSIPLFVLALVLSNPLSIHAQDKDALQGPVYIEISYMKSKNDDYVKMEKELWKPVHTARIKGNNLLWWGLYSVISPYGTENKYDYVTINAYQGIGQALAEDDDSGILHAFETAHTGKNIEALFDRTDASRDMVGSKIFRVLDHAVPVVGGSPGKYLVVNGMHVDTGHDEDYIKMEKEIFKPAHKSAVDAGFRKNWHLLALTLPSGTKYSTNYMTMDEYDKISNHYNPLPPQVWEAAHPGMDIDEMLHNVDMESTRELLTSHVWRLVDYTKIEVE